MIETIIFDLGGVICPLNKSRMLAEWSAATSLPSDRLVESFFESGLKEKVDRGSLSLQDAHAEVCERLGITQGFVQFQDLWNLVLELDDEMDGLVARLASFVPCALLSNTDPVHYAHAVQIAPCLSSLPQHTLSFDVGSIKPEEEIFRVALRQTGFDVSTTLLVDDRLKNIDAALRLGFQGHHFQTQKGLEDDLRALLRIPESIIRRQD